jgi:hypothetical protein
MKRAVLTLVLGIGLAGTGWALAQPANPKPGAGGPGPGMGRGGAMMGGGMMGGGMMMGGMCPMMGGTDVKVDVKNVDGGVTITYSSTDPAKVTRLQKWAAGMRLMHEAMVP